MQRDLLCIGCGYNLRTLGFGAACPECGSPVLASLRARRGLSLGLTDPHRLRRIAAGAWLLAGGALPLALLGLSAASRAWGWLVVPTPLTASLACVGWGAALPGAWLVTTPPDPSSRSLPVTRWPARGVGGLAVAVAAWNWAAGIPAVAWAMAVLPYPPLLAYLAGLCEKAGLGVGVQRALVAAMLLPIGATLAAALFCCADTTSKGGALVLLAAHLFVALPLAALLGGLVAFARGLTRLLRHRDDATA